LRIVRDGAVEAEVQLTTGHVRIGRSPDNDVVLDEPTRAVSRHHAEVRYHDGRYVLIDLNSQNGTWVGGHSIRQVDLVPEVLAAIGPYTLMLTAATAAGSARRVEGRVVAASAPEREAAPPAAGPAARPRRRVASGTPAPQGVGPIAWLARQPKPLLFGGVALFIVVLLTVLNLLSPQPDKLGGGKASTRTNEEAVAALLAEGRALLDKGDASAALGRFEHALIIKPDHPPALELRMRAQEQMRSAPAGRTEAPR
jgi:hypothetical protein